MTNERFKKFSIELDCAPGLPRPGDLIGGVLEDTGLTEEDFDTGLPLFGHQTWILKEDPEKDKLFEKAKYLQIKPRVIALFNQGAIRYGTW